VRLRSVLVALAGAATALLLAGAPAAAGDSVDVQVVIPADGMLTIDSAQLRWGLSQEASSGAYAFGCQFLSAGVAGDTGSSRAWTEADGFYRGSAGHVRIEKPGADGRDRVATWATRCLDREGSPVTASTSSPTTESEVVVDGGSGTVDQGAGSARIAWTGSFTVAFYGGLTYWSATDPVLTVRDGVGTLTATASGYGADRDDTSRWVRIPPRTVTLARFAHVDLGENGFVVTPDYLGVEVDAGTGTPQAARTSANAAYWGAFPQDFVDLQLQTGQSAYWYTSGGERDPFKAALPVTVSYDSSRPVTPPKDPDDSGSTPGGPAPSNPLTTPPATAPQGVTPPRLGGTSVPPTVTGPDVTSAAYPATQAVTVGAASTLIPLVQDAAGWLTGQDPLLLGGLAAIAALGAFAAIGLWRGWLVVPWTGWRT